jgi:hypothetical protein
LSSEVFFNGRRSRSSRDYSQGDDPAEVIKTLARLS